MPPQKASDAVVAEIREAWAKRPTRRRLAAKYCLSEATVAKILNDPDYRPSPEELRPRISDEEFERLMHADDDVPRGT